MLLLEPAARHALGVECGGGRHRQDALSLFVPFAHGEIAFGGKFPQPYVPCRVAVERQHVAVEEEARLVRREFPPRDAVGPDEILLGETLLAEREGPFAQSGTPLLELVQHVLLVEVEGLGERVASGRRQPIFQSAPSVAAVPGRDHVAGHRRGVRAVHPCDGHAPARVVHVADQAVPDRQEHAPFVRPGQRRAPLREIGVERSVGAPQVPHRERHFEVPFRGVRGRGDEIGIEPGVEVAELPQQVGPPVGQQPSCAVVADGVFARTFHAAAARVAVVHIGEGVEPLAAAHLAQRAYGAPDDERFAGVAHHAQRRVGVVSRDDAPEVVGVDVPVRLAAHAVELDDVVAPDAFGPVHEGHVAGRCAPQRGQRLAHRVAVTDHPGAGMAFAERFDDGAPLRVVGDAGSGDDRVVRCGRGLRAGVCGGGEEKQQDSFHIGLRF